MLLLLRESGVVPPAKPIVVLKDAHCYPEEAQAAVLGSQIYREYRSYLSQLRKQVRVKTARFKEGGVLREVVAEESRTYAVPFEKPCGGPSSR